MKSNMFKYFVSCIFFSYSIGERNGLRLPPNWKIKLRNQHIIDLRFLAWLREIKRKQLVKQLNEVLKHRQYSQNLGMKLMKLPLIVVQSVWESAVSCWPDDHFWFNVDSTSSEKQRKFILSFLLFAWCHGDWAKIT